MLRLKGRARLAVAGLLVVSLPLAWARFVEPHLLVVHRATIALPGATETSPSIRIALFSDTHLGIFPSAMPLTRIVRRINAEHVDGVFLAGDLSYWPRTEDVPELFAPLGDLDAPLYAVLGNHDVGYPGNDLTDALMAALQDAGALIPQNRAFDTELGGHRVIVAGASDLWQRRQDFGFSASLPEGVPVLLLTHNPDTALYVPDNFAYDLMLAGHTHGGQLRVPFFFKRVIPTIWDFDRELQVYPSDGGDRLVYITTGTGMSNLPLRFNMPPRIDILTLHLPE
ncbi:MAG: metallophosphoesterase family protein [Acidobacteria bacterium]|nr:metallophosphoesterase family protein [Acidobacteriota bacterium]